MVCGGMPRTGKLRCTAMDPAFRVVLVAPEIPPNTGAVARTCAATGSPLHLIEPLGFDIDERAVRRAGIDYWHLVDLHVHPTLTDFRADHPAGRMHLFSTDASRSYLDVDFEPGDSLVFGCESVGLPRELLQAHPDRVCGIPTSGAVRSLNLSNSVAIALYEALRAGEHLSPTFVEAAAPPEPS